MSLTNGEPLPPKRLFYRDDLLVSVSYKTCAAWRADMARPETAIYAVPSGRSLRILLDKDGSLASLKEMAVAFVWPPLQDAADAFASRALMLGVEDVHKALAAERYHDSLAAVPATTALLQVSTRAVATQRGPMVISCNTFHRQLIESVGTDHSWSRALCLALGADHNAAGNLSVEARTLATLDPFRETATLLAPILAAGHREVVENAIRMIARAG